MTESSRAVRRELGGRRSRLAEGRARNVEEHSNHPGGMSLIRRDLLPKKNTIAAATGARANRRWLSWARALRGKIRERSERLQNLNRIHSNELRPHTEVKKLSDAVVDVSVREQLFPRCLQVHGFLFSHFWSVVVNKSPTVFETEFESHIPVVTTRVVWSPPAIVCGVVCKSIRV